MRLRILLYIFCIACITPACSPRYLIVTWKKNRVRFSYDKILVTSLVKDSTADFRLMTERGLANEFSQIGYYAVSVTDQFGPAGLKDLDQGATYARLCEKGIDAIMVVALIDRAKDKSIFPPKNARYTDNYYYNRIWNYRQIVADRTAPEAEHSSGYCWEIILFDLRTLEAVCTMQTPTFLSLAGDGPREWQYRAVRMLLKEKILKKKPKINQPLRAF